MPTIDEKIDALTMKTDAVLAVLQSTNAAATAAYEAGRAYVVALATGADYRESYEALVKAVVPGWTRAGGEIRERMKFVNIEAIVAAFFAIGEEGRRPDGYRNGYTPDQAPWPIVERLLDEVGKPVAFAEMAKIMEESCEVPRLAGDKAAEIVNRAARWNDLVPARTKIDGKAAYLVRERREGETPPLHGWGRGSMPTE